MLRLLFRCIIDVSKPDLFLLFSKPEPSLFSHTCPIFILQVAIGYSTFHHRKIWLLSTKQATANLSRLKSHADLTLELMDTIRPLHDEHAACLWFTMIYQFKLMRSETSKFSFTTAPHLSEVLVLLGGLCSYMQMSWNTSKSKSISSHIIMEVPNCFKTSLLYNRVACSSLIMRRVVFLPSMNKHREWLTTPLGTLPQISRKICECISFMRCSSRLM